MIYTTCPDEQSASDMADKLVSRRLAACVSMIPGMTSFYMWQGKREESDECLLLIKTSSASYQAVEDCIRALHPYELPEIVAVPFVAGLPGYFEWIGSGVG